MLDLNLILNYILLLIKDFQINNNISDKFSKVFRNNLIKAIKIKVNNFTNNNNMIVNRIINNLFLIDLIIIITIKMFIVFNNIIINQIFIINFILRNRYHLYIIYFYKSSTH